MRKALCGSVYGLQTAECFLSFFFGYHRFRYFVPFFSEQTSEKIF